LSASWDALLAASGLPRLEARALLEHASGRDRSWLIGHGDETAPEPARSSFAALVARRRAGAPLAHLTGFREFHGLRMRVSPAVLIPRADTELLVELATRLAPACGRMLDLGTGSGAVAIAVAVQRPDLEILATDLSGEALAIAAGNARDCLAPASGERIRFLAGSWWAALPAGEPPFDLVASNPPYIAAGDPHLALGDLPHEPVQALASGADGLDAIRTIAAGARPHLTEGGWLLLEHGFDQGAAVRALLEAAGLERIATHRDPGGHERVTLGRNPAPGPNPSV
jgi:release factor glutamine methyltransferase